MDFSKEYIEMCQKAEEIQAIKPTVDKNESKDFGSFYYWCKGNYEEIALLHDDNDTGWVCIGGYHTDMNLIVWLPRQDQLQEMVEEKFGGQRVSMLQYFSGWLKEDKSIPYRIEVTLEQLWLCFVMEEKFNKIWTGTDWVKEAQ